MRVSAFVNRLYLFKAYCVKLCVCVCVCVCVCGCARTRKSRRGGGPQRRVTAAWQTLHTSLASEESQSPPTDPPLRLPAYSSVSLMSWRARERKESERGGWVGRGKVREGAEGEQKNKTRKIKERVSANTGMGIDCVERQ